MTFSFSQRSLKALEGVHPDLVKVSHAALAISPLDFGIIEGVRTGERQHELFLAGKSQLDWPTPPGKLQGRHLGGFAVDFLVYVEGVATFDVQYYPQVADAFKSAAHDLGIPISCGADWVHFKDEDHVELDRVAYPDEPDPLLIA